MVQRITDEIGQERRRRGGRFGRRILITAILDAVIAAGVAGLFSGSVELVPAGRPGGLAGGIGAGRRWRSARSFGPSSPP